MNKLSLFVLIVPREAGARWQGFLNETGPRTLFSFPCLGTAGQSLRERLGLRSDEKTLFLGATPHKNVRRMMRRAVSDMGLNVDGSGIAMALPFTSVGGQTALDGLLGGQAFDPEEVNPMDFSVYPYSLIVAITGNGFSGAVMDAAREAGAGGGTVVHAKGTADRETGKFLGVALADEKEMVLILVREESRRAVMRSVMDKAGVHSPAHTVLFSLPVEDIAGLKSIMKEED